MTREYARACTELVEIFKHLPRSEYEKIPKEDIEFYEKNKDTDYVYRFDPLLELEEQDISPMTNAIILTIFRDYFASNEEKEKMQEILKKNTINKEIEKTKKYNSNDIFKNTKNMELQTTNNVEKNNIFKTIFNKIKSLFTKK